MTAATEAKPSIALTILDEVQTLRQEVETLRQFAEVLGRPQGEDESFMANVARLFSLLVSGTEKTHASLESLHSLMTEPGIARALRRAISDE
jgi:predicted RNA binding protein with dsRBD fold (UPF0201 family)